jgi:psiF repeat
MRYLFVALAAAVLCASAYAQDKKAPENKEPTEQQKRMQECNANAKKQNFKGKEDRQAFMSACLKEDKPAAAAGTRTPQQERMAQCNKDAGTKKLAGEDRKKFMAECLRG